MKMHSNDQGGVVTVSLTGEIDLQHSPNLRRQLMDLMFDRRDVLVELAGVSYIDSSGIACLVEAYQAARKNGTRFVLVAVSAPVMRVLQLARLDKVFALAETAEAALAS
jgi:anti-sigma B factor antagonist